MSAVALIFGAILGLLLTFGIPMAVALFGGTWWLAGLWGVVFAFFNRPLQLYNRMRFATAGLVGRLMAYRLLFSIPSAAFSVGIWWATRAVFR